MWEPEPEESSSSEELVGRRRKVESKKFLSYPIPSDEASLLPVPDHRRVRSLARARGNPPGKRASKSRKQSILLLGNHAEAVRSSLKERGWKTVEERVPSPNTYRLALEGEFAAVYYEPPVGSFGWRGRARQVRSRLHPLGQAELSPDEQEESRCAL